MGLLSAFVTKFSTLNREMLLPGELRTIKSLCSPHASPPASAVGGALTGKGNPHTGTSLVGPKVWKAEMLFEPWLATYMAFWCRVIVPGGGPQGGDVLLCPPHPSMIPAARIRNTSL